jgi:hypothetical protein
MSAADPVVVRIHALARHAWPWLPEAAPPGSIWIAPCGERVRVRDDGTAAEVGEVPRRWSAAADPCAIGRRHLHP